MHGDYEDRYIPTLLQALGVDHAEPFGDIENTSAPQPHTAAFFQLGGDRFVGTTCGISALPVPIASPGGFEYFELITLTSDHSPGVLWTLSNIATYMLGAMSPMFYGDAATIDPAQSPSTFRPYQTLLFGGDGTRFLLVPRFALQVPMGPIVDAVELLPLTLDDWDQLRTMDELERASWVSSLDPAGPNRWTPLLDLGDA